MFYCGCILTIPQTSEVIKFGRWYTRKPKFEDPRFLQLKANKILREKGINLGFTDYFYTTRNAFEKIYHNSYDELFNFNMQCIKTSEAPHTKLWR